MRSRIELRFSLYWTLENNSSAKYFNTSITGDIYLATNKPMYAKRMPAKLPTVYNKLNNLKTNESELK